LHWGWYATVLSIAAIDWLAVGFNHPRWRLISKPGMMLVLITGFTLAGGWQGAGAWFGLGLTFSLVGDVLLMLPPGYFISGLAAFLLAHLAYIIGFNQSLIMPDLEIIFPVLGLIIIDIFGYRRIRTSLMCRQKDRWIRFPILGYMIVISLMLFSSLLCWFRPDWPHPAAALVSLGAFLFYVSDTTLAFNRFCRPVRGGQVVVIVSYHLAQIAIVAGVLFRAAHV